MGSRAGRADAVAGEVPPLRLSARLSASRREREREGKRETYLPRLRTAMEFLAVFQCDLAPPAAGAARGGFGRKLTVPPPSSKSAPPRSISAATAPATIVSIIKGLARRRLVSDVLAAWLVTPFPWSLWVVRHTQQL